MMSRSRKGHLSFSNQIAAICLGIVGAQAASATISYTLDLKKCKGLSTFIFVAKTQLQSEGKSFVCLLVASNLSLLFLLSFAHAITVDILLCHVSTSHLLLTPHFLSSTVSLPIHLATGPISKAAQPGKISQTVFCFAQLWKAALLRRGEEEALAKDPTFRRPSAGTCDRQLIKTVSNAAKYLYFLLLTQMKSKIATSKSRKLHCIHCFFTCWTFNNPRGNTWKRYYYVLLWSTTANTSTVVEISLLELHAQMSTLDTIRTLSPAFLFYIQKDQQI